MTVSYVAYGRKAQHDVEASACFGAMCHESRISNKRTKEGWFMFKKPKRFRGVFTNIGNPLGFTYTHDFPSAWSREACNSYCEQLKNLYLFKKCVLGYSLRDRRLLLHINIEQNPVVLMIFLSILRSRDEKAYANNIFRNALRESQKESAKNFSSFDPLMISAFFSDVMWNARDAKNSPATLKSAIERQAMLPAYTVHQPFTFTLEGATVDEDCVKAMIRLLDKPGGLIHHAKKMFEPKTTWRNSGFMTSSWEDRQMGVSSAGGLNAYVFYKAFQACLEDVRNGKK